MINPNRTVVIGGGVAGLATAGLLGRAGHRVTLLEQNDQLGGRAGRLDRDGFRFDTGPSWYLMPEVIDHWFTMLGTSAADELQLHKLAPAYRVWFECQESPTDVVTGQAERLFEGLEAGAGERLRAYLESAAEVYELAKRHFLYNNFASVRRIASLALLKELPRLVPLLGHSLHSLVHGKFADPRLRQILGYPAVFLGTSPRRAPALYHLMSHLDLDDGVYYPQGGFAALVDAMARIAEANGVDIITGARASAVETTGAGKRCRVSAVRWTDGAGDDHLHPAETVVGAADLHHLETHLLPPSLQTWPERSWKRRDPGASAVLVMLGVRGKLPQLAHHNLFFTTDWDDNFGRIQKGRRLSDPTSLYLCRPSATDATVAPSGCENLFVLVPAPARPDWGNGGADGGGSPDVERVADAAIAQVGRWAGIGDLTERIVVRQTVGPGDFSDSFNAWRGSALGMAHTLGQSAFLRPGNRSRKVAGLHYAGSSVRPGIGVPMCLISAEVTAGAIVSSLGSTLPDDSAVLGSERRS